MPTFMTAANRIQTLHVRDPSFYVCRSLDSIFILFLNGDMSTYLHTALRHTHKAVAAKITGSYYVSQRRWKGQSKHQCYIAILLEGVQAKIKVQTRVLRNRSLSLG